MYSIGLYFRGIFARKYNKVETDRKADTVCQGVGFTYIGVGVGHPHAKHGFAIPVILCFALFILNALFP